MDFNNCKFDRFQKVQHLINCWGNSKHAKTQRSSWKYNMCRTMWSAIWDIRVTAEHIISCMTRSNFYCTLARIDRWVNRDNKSFSKFTLCTARAAIARFLLRPSSAQLASFPGFPVNEDLRWSTRAEANIENNRCCQPSNMKNSHTEWLQLKWLQLKALHQKL